MPLHNYQCECGEEQRDLYFPISEVPKYLVCKDCGSRMHQTWGKGFNKKRSLTEILGNHNAKHHPQFGYDFEVESPEHYRQLLKEYEMEEAGDTIGGNRDWNRERIEDKRSEYAKPRRALADIATDEQVEAALKQGE